MRAWQSLWTRFGNSRRQQKSLLRSAIERLEDRCPLAADTIQIGMIYVEEDIGSDRQGDRFELTFSGGAEATQLKSIVLDGNLEAVAFGVGDVIFDTVEFGTTGDLYGADHAFPFTLISHPGIDRVDVQVVDGTSLLRLDFMGFEAGDRLVFTIDVDEIEEFNPQEADRRRIHDGIDPITSGVEFQGTKFAARFQAPGYRDAEINSVFRNRYDEALQASGLQLPEDDFGGKRDRSAGAFGRIDPAPLPISIAGNVFEDLDRDLRRDAQDPLLADVVLELWRRTETGQFVSTGHTTRTDRQGHYEFTESLGLTRGVYEVRERQPSDYFSVGAIPGSRSDGRSTGQVVSDNPDVLTAIEIPLGGMHVTNLDFAEARPAEVSGRVHVAGPDGDCFVDPQDATPIAGVRIQLFDSVSNRLIAETVTHAQGLYSFRGLRPGSYRVVEHTPSGWLDGADHVGTVNGRPSGQNIRNDEIDHIQLPSSGRGVDYDFCEVLPAKISGFVFHDRDRNEAKEMGESGIQNVVIQLFDGNGQFVAQTTTDANGAYHFDGLMPGVYRIHEIQPEDWKDGGDQLGTVDGRPSGAVDGNDRFRDIRLPSGGAGVDYNFGEVLPGSLSGFVHVDPDQDCVVDTGELMLAGVRIELWADGQLVATTLTDANGRYAFTDLRPRVYTVREIQPDGYFQGGQRAGAGGGDDDRVDEISQIFLGPGEQLTDYLFCELPPSELSGYVFQDGSDVKLRQGESLPEDVSPVRDGTRTPDDRPIAGVVLELRHGITAKPISTSAALPGIYFGETIRVTTDATGHYHFRGLAKGNYSVYQLHPAGYLDGVDTPGSTLGISVNAGRAVAPAILQTLEQDPRNDAILRIALPPGVHSRENNFSEVRVVQPEPFIPVPPLPQTPIPPASQSRSVLEPQQPARTINPIDAIPRPAYRVQRALGYTWHLSVTNAGSPRQSVDHQVSEVRHTAPVWRPVGLRRTSTAGATKSGGQWWLFSTESKKRLPQTVHFDVGAGIPIAGDFNGDGSAEVGLFDRGHWFIDLNGNGIWDNDDLWARLGYQGDLPVVGDWDGDGKDDIGIFGRAWPGDPRAIEAEPGLPDSQNQRESQPKNLPPQATRGRRELQATAQGLLRTDLIDHVFHYGAIGDAPVVGDWNGDGIRSIGIFRNGEWRLDVDGDGDWSHADRRCLFGRREDVPLAGDWNGDGVDEIGVFARGTFYLDDNGNGVLDRDDTVLETGAVHGRPVIGDWDGNGIDDVGVHVEDAQAPLRRAQR